MKRSARIQRTTQETDIRVKLNLDGKGVGNIHTSVPFLDHMLTLFAKHGFFDLEIQATGDVEIDYHHTVEDVGICLGQAFQEALGDKAGIRRYGEASVPMIDSLARVVVDLSGRAHLVYHVPLPSNRVGNMDVELFEEFFRAFSSNAGMDLHVHLTYGANVHHAIEAVFKAAARAFDLATTKEPRQTGVQSTKGTLT